MMNLLQILHYKDEYIKAFDDIEPFAPVNIESFS